MEQTPSTTTNPSEARDVNLEVFINKKLQQIHDEASPTASDQKDLRDKCKELIDSLSSNEFGRQGSRLTFPFPLELTDQLLYILKTALSFSQPKFAEPALACLHKLVAYAYFSGETRPSGRLDDPSLVTQVVMMTSKAADSPHPGVQLQVAKAVLTYVTAEHFLPHGDCLMSAIRTAFNVAVGGATADVRNTARSALLQMLNTVLKRVVQQLTPGNTPIITPVQRYFSNTPGSTHRPGSSDRLGAAAAGPEPRALFAQSSSQQTLSSAAASSAQHLVGGEEGYEEEEREASLEPSTPPHTHPSSNIVVQTEEGGNVSNSSLTFNPQLGTVLEDASLHAGQAGGTETETNDNLEGETPKLTLSPSFQAHQSRLPRINTPLSGGSSSGEISVHVSELSPSAQQAQHAERQRLEEERTARLASLADQGDLQGLEKALGAMQTPDSASQHAQQQQQQQQQQQIYITRQETPPDPRRALMREARAAEWRALTVAEKDASLVLGAICKMAARDTGIGGAESYMHSGKLLALDFLVKVLSNPMHDWSLIRPEFAAQLRQPLCIVMLRNCAAPYEAAVTAALKVLQCVLQADKLRCSLKVEVGALYPLMLLRPLEAEKPESAHAVLKAVEGLLAVTSSPQILADVFVNYDCSLQAANLFERSMKALTRAVKAGQQPGGLSITPATAVTQIRATAMRAMIAAIKSLDAWAGPLKSAVDGFGTAEGAATSTGLDEGADGVERTENQDSVDTHTNTNTNASLKGLHSDVLERIHANKEMKASLQAGIAAFNTGDPFKALMNLRKQGVLAAGPAAAATFLIDNSPVLDPAAVGELLGDHHEEAVEIMHAYVEMDNYTDLTLDDALRKLISKFRLPGEAQKIDRIMEKFAERYCCHNPGAFPAADAAYLLAFAIIMLNTDAHNPMAEGRMSAEDFVGMAMYQGEHGEFLPIMGEAELRELYQRIKTKEIQVAPTAGSNAFTPSKSNNDLAGEDSTIINQQVGAKANMKYKGGARLAAALGLTQLVGPFGAGNTWDKQHGVDVERKRILELTRELINNTSSTPSGGIGGYSSANNSLRAGGLWHTATHAEHARPMLQVAGPSILSSLSSGVAAADTLPVALTVLDAFVLAARLAALLRIESLCERLVAGLAAAAAIDAPAPPMTSAEARQVAALSKLVSLGTSSEAGFLGSGWSVLLRTLSRLEALRMALIPGSTQYPPGSNFLPQNEDEDASAAASRPLGRLLERMGLGSSTSSSTTNGLSSSLLSAPISNIGSLAVRQAPGMGAVLWAETAGAGPIDQLFQRSASLDGDSVLTFFSALCAVSQEELYPAEREPPRVYLLQRVVECSYLNAGRIRLVWLRLWTIVSQHLVSAACHNDAYVAMYAVDALRQLADKLLCRSELTGFTSQGDALRPLTAVLRLSDNPSVRELAAACVAHAVSAHARRLGSGWRSVLDALSTAASDPSPAVVTQALDILQTVAELLYVSNEGAGHGLLKECALTARAVVENASPAVEDLGATALYVFQQLARRLAEAPFAITTSTTLSSPSDVHGVSGSSPGSRGEEESEGLWAAVLCPLTSIALTDPRPRTADTAVAVLFQILHAQGAIFTPSLWNMVFKKVVLPIFSLDHLSSSKNDDSSNSNKSESTNTPIQSEPRKKVYKPSSRRLVVLMSPAERDRFLLFGLGQEGQPPPEGKVERTLRHAEAHIPDLWSLFVDVPGANKAGLEFSLDLLRTYITSSDSLCVSLGVEQLLGMLSTAVPAASDDSAWTAAAIFFEQLLQQFSNPLPLLQGNTNINTNNIKETTTTNGKEAIEMNMTSGNGTADNAHDEEEEEAIRRHCKVTILMLRAAHAALINNTTSINLHSSSESNPSPSLTLMPVEARFRFLDAMLAAVHAASAINANPASRHALLSSAPPSYTTLMTSTRALSSHQHQEEHQSGQSGQSQEERPGTAGSSLWDQPPLPALVRQEAEGGYLVIDALIKTGLTTTSSSSGTSSNGGSTLGIEDAYILGCKERLVKYCTEVLDAAVSRVGSSTTSHGSNSSGGGAAAVLPWEDAVRSPLVESALRALCALPAEDWKAQRPAVFAGAAQLVRSRNLGVRRAVRELMQKQAAASLQQQMQQMQK